MSVVVIAGMHRSGTSLLANLFQESGLHIGDRLLESSFSNIKGHFEDTDFKDFHDSVIDEINPLLLYVEQLLALSPEHRQAARRLIDARRELGNWGWKDPRTVLFLDLWKDLLPAAQFVFVFRRPEWVVDSLRRRQTDGPLFRNFRLPRPFSRIGFRHFRVTRATEMWNSYNRKIVEFIHANPDCSSLINLEHLLQSLPKVFNRLEQRGIVLQQVSAEQVLDPSLLKSDAATSVLRACKKNSETQKIFRELQDLSIVD